MQWVPLNETFISSKIATNKGGHLTHTRGVGNSIIKPLVEVTHRLKLL